MAVRVPRARRAKVLDTHGAVEVPTPFHELPGADPVRDHLAPVGVDVHDNNVAGCLFVVVGDLGSAGVAARRSGPMSVSECCSPSVT